MKLRRIILLAESLCINNNIIIVSFIRRKSRGPFLIKPFYYLYHPAYLGINIFTLGQIVLSSLHMWYRLGVAFESIALGENDFNIPPMTQTLEGIADDLELLDKRKSYKIKNRIMEVATIEKRIDTAYNDFYPLIHVKLLKNS